MSKFIPSAASLSPREMALKQVRAVKQAADYVEKYLKMLPDDAVVPSWVLMRITESSSVLSMAVGYISNQLKKEASHEIK